MLTNNNGDVIEILSMTTSSDPTSIARKCFIEVIPNENSTCEHPLPEWIDCYVVKNIQRSKCEPLARELNAWQRDFTTATTTISSSSSLLNNFDTITSFPRIDHLKRIRRRPATAEEIEVRNASEHTIVREVIHDAKRNVARTVANGCKNGEHDGKEIAPVATQFPLLSHSVALSNEKHETVSGKKINQKKRNKPGESSSAAISSSASSAAQYSLDLLIGCIISIDYSVRTTDVPNNLSLRLNSILERYNIHPHRPTNSNSNTVIRQTLPGRPAKTKIERQEWNISQWPTLFFKEQTVMYKEEKLVLTTEEINMMKLGMKEAVKDAMVGRDQWNDWIVNINKSNDNFADIKTLSGAVVMNPNTGSIVSRASEERSLQGIPENSKNEIFNLLRNDSRTTPTTSAIAAGSRSKMVHPTRSWSIFPDVENPMLCTSVLLAIQGVSRKERDIVMGYGIQSLEFPDSQYLCTGFDVYLSKEPNVYEAMALVHSRVRRVVFGIPDREMGGLGYHTTADVTTGAHSQGMNIGIHSLPGTNHHYRAFQFDSTCDCDDEEDVSSLKQSLMLLHPDIIPS